MLTVAIQAGGQSQRMGRDKALVPLAGKPLIEHLLAQVSDLGEEVLITTNNPPAYAYLDFRLVSDPIPDMGALAGIHTALAAAHGDTVLVLACDLPFVCRPLLEHLISLAPKADVVIPDHDGRYEPLHAVYNKHNCLPLIEEEPAAGEKQIISFFPSLRVLSVKEPDLSRLDERGLSFFNVNTPEDLARAESLLADGL